MFIILESNNNETITQQFSNYINNFDIDEEIDTHRQDKNYKNAFTIKESLKDFESWLEYCKEIEMELLK